MKTQNEKEDEKAIVLNNQVSMLIKKFGLEKTILHLQAVNKDNKRNSDMVDIYEFIIKTVTSIFNITEVQLYQSSKHFISTEARMTAYYLIYTYANCTHNDIGMQFNKTRIRVTLVLKELKGRIEDRHIHKDFFVKHESAEKLVKEFVESVKKKKK